MDDRLMYSELGCYKDANETLLRKIGKNDYYDLSPLRSETMKDEFRRFISHRGSQVSLNTVQHDKAYFRQLCEALRTRKNIPDSLLGWEEAKWVQFLKGWMLKNGIALNREKRAPTGQRT